MISDFSSFLEFIAAVYTSMYFDRVFDFWSPKYKYSLNESLERNNWTKDSLFSSTLKSASNKWYEGIRRSMLNRAAFMVLSIVAILVFIGFEDILKNVGNLSMAYSSLVITWTITLVLVLGVFNRFFFSKMKRMFLALLFELILFVVSFLYIVPHVPAIGYLTKYVLISLLVFTLLPITFQIIVSWLSSTPYAEYIKKRLPSFKKEFDNAQECLKTRDLSLLSPDFKDVITEMFVQGESSDTSMEKYQKLLQDKMLLACQPQSIAVVFKSWIVFQFEYLKGKIKGKPLMDNVEEERVYEMPVEFRKPQVNIDFDEEYEKYRAEKKLDYRLSLREYCKKYSISPSEMISWVKANRPLK